MIVLHGLSTGWHFQFSPKAKVSESQRVAMEVVNRVERFCAQPVEVVQLPSFPELVTNRQLDYSGQELATALPLRLEELLPGLPHLGVAGSLSALKAAAVEVKERVENPWLT